MQIVNALLEQKIKKKIQRYNAFRFELVSYLYNGKKNVRIENKKEITNHLKRKKNIASLKSQKKEVKIKSD